MDGKVVKGMAISSYEIALKSVTEQRPLSEKLAHVHNVICERLPSIKRIAVAIYDAKSDLLKTFVHSTDGENPSGRRRHKRSREVFAVCLGLDAQNKLSQK
ncbi:hypothetical protein [Solemya pervernicosa gill symbiont]|uniref:hypothetical protein n=1 Tax=Solemya pervernicosa gill symbiont TaxID=642797 RepID=UPI001F42FC9B|nr:hypothetical protein [Solemya pervernicosa gill symbiont]